MEKKFNKQIVLAAKCKDAKLQMKSQSGGMFVVIANYILEHNGVIYGCCLNNEYIAIHKRVTTKAGCDALKGSKYVQSNLGNCFVNIKNDLKSNLKVLFVGTPCQVAGLKNILTEKEKDNIILVDIVCHGVPSPGVWKDFLKYLNEKHSNVSNIIFRNKKYGWESSICTFLVNGKEYKNNTYNTLFYKHYILRPSCYECKFKNIRRLGDITIGDCWGIKKGDPDFYDKNGVSIMLINNQRGLALFHEINRNIIYKEVDIKNYLQPALNKNYQPPKDRDTFWNLYKTKSFEYISKKYGGNNIHTKIKKFIKKILKR